MYKGFEAMGAIGDPEGRIVTVEFKDMYVMSVYVPNSKPDLSRLEYRTTEWDVQLRSLIAFYQKNKPVVVCGDFNVAHTTIDIFNAKGKNKTHGFTPAERESFGVLLEEQKLVDVWRELNPNVKKWTWWSNFAKSRERNVGWRIDYILVSKSIQSKVKSMDLLNDVMGSDHCPVLLVIL